MHNVLKCHGQQHMEKATLRSLRENNQRSLHNMLIAAIIHSNMCTMSSRKWTRQHFNFMTHSLLKREDITIPFFNYLSQMYCKVIFGSSFKRFFCFHTNHTQFSFNFDSTFYSNMYEWLGVSTKEKKILEFSFKSLLFSFMKQSDMVFPHI